MYVYREFTLNTDVLNVIGTVIYGKEDMHIYLVFVAIYLRNKESLFKY